MRCTAGTRRGSVCSRRSCRAETDNGMKILVAQDALHSEGGVESYLAAIIPALRARGHSIAMLFVRRGSAVPLVNGIDGPCVGVAPERLDWALAEVNAWNPDVCFSNNMAPLDVERALLDQGPVVKFMHAYFGTCISALKTHEFPIGCACSRTLGPACLALYVPRHCGALRPAALEPIRKKYSPQLSAMTGP